MRLHFSGMAAPKTKIRFTLNSIFNNMLQQKQGDFDILMAQKLLLSKYGLLLEQNLTIEITGTLFDMGFRER